MAAELVGSHLPPDRQSDDWEGGKRRGHMEVTAAASALQRLKCWISFSRHGGPDRLSCNRLKTLCALSSCSACSRRSPACFGPCSARWASKRSPSSTPYRAAASPGPSTPCTASGGPGAAGKVGRPRQAEEGLVWRRVWLDCRPRHLRMSSASWLAPGTLHVRD